MGKKGKLLFKGEKRPKKKSKKPKIGSGDRDGTDSQLPSSSPSSSSNGVKGSDNIVTAANTTTSNRKATSASASAAASTPTIQKGTGRITTSGTVVSGHGTKFEKEISIGDAILVTINNNDAEEMRVVTMRLSNASVNLSSAFSQNLSEPQNFRYVRKPRNMEQEQRKERQKQMEAANETEKSAFDIYGKLEDDGGDGNGNSNNTNTFTYREKTETGSYRVKQQHLSSSQSTRGGLLDLRSKKTSDKYC